MAISKSIDIINIHALKVHEEKEHVITKVVFVVKAEDGEFSHAMGGESNLTYDKDNFVDWEDTDAFKTELLKWIESDTEPLLKKCELKVNEKKADNNEELSFS